MFKIFYILLFFPSITFNLVNAEIFPWGLLFSLCVFLKNKKITKEYTLFLIIIFFYSILGYINTDSAPEVLRSSFAYLNSFSVFFAIFILKDKDVNLLLNVIKKIFIFFIIFGFMQSLDTINFLDQTISVLMQRGSSTLVDTIRGVTLLASEPSRAAYEFLLVYLIFRYYFIRKTIIFDLFVFLYLFLIIKSVTGVALFFVFIGLEILVSKKNKLIVYLLVFLSIIYIISLNLDYISNFGRAGIFIENLFEFNSFKEISNFIIKQSGFRLVSILSPIYSIFDNLFGYGIGNWKNASLEVLDKFDVYSYNISYFKYNCEGDIICPVRTTSIFSTLLLDFGLIFTLIIIYLLYKTFKKYFAKKIYISCKEKPYLYFFIFLFFFMSQIGHPYIWIYLALILKKNKRI